MRGIEEGRLTEDYPAIVEPFREIFRKIAMLANGEGLNLILAHDYRHFAYDFKPVFSDTPLAEAFHSSFVAVRQNLVAALDYYLTPGKLTLTPFTNERLRRRFGSGVAVAPFVKNYAETIFDSASYLESLAGANIAEEEKSLLRLTRHRVPIAPICSYYKSRLLVDGNESPDSDVALDGLKFISFYNSLTNARDHSVPVEEGAIPVVAVDFQSADGRITLTNDSEYHLRNSIQYLFEDGEYGFLIAHLYAALSDVELQLSSERDGTFNEGRTVSPKYKVKVSLG